MPEDESRPFVPDGFAVPTELDADGLRLVPLGPEHNQADYAAWTSSIDHIRATPGWEGRSWPQPMTLDENRADLERHAADFASRAGFTYTVLDPTGAVVGCVYIYPPQRPGDDGADAEVRSWVRASHATRDADLYRAVSRWLAETWPFQRVRYSPRPSAG